MLAWFLSTSTYTKYRLIFMFSYSGVIYCPFLQMDADYDPNAASLNDRNYGLDGRSKRSKRKKNRLKKALEKKKPLFNPGINGSK